MRRIRVKNGYDLKIDGKPSLEKEVLAQPTHVAVLPAKIPYVKPRLKVKVGDRVKVGSILFEDKRRPEIKFLSPGGGKIDQINFGHRRAITEIVIALDTDEEYERFSTISESEMDTIERHTLVRLLQDGGLWPLIRALPFRDIAKSGDVPPSIIVNIDNSEPFHPRPEVFLKEKKDLLNFGLKVLRQLTDGNTFVAVSQRHPDVIRDLDGLTTHTLSGKYPLHDPGVLLYHIRKSPAQNRSWYVNGQHLLLIAQLLQSGRYPVERLVVVSGSAAPKKKHIQTRQGVPLANLVQARIQDEDTRLVAGGIFTGHTASIKTYLGFYETAITLLPKGGEREFMAFVRPGINKPSYSRTFFSYLNKADLDMNCNLHGGERACIACGHCVDVCPVEILPQLTFKSVLAGEVEESLEHGLLDCVECGLCSYVCPSKIELFHTLKTAKADYYKEIA